jgi:hypothetical protein
LVRYGRNTFISEAAPDMPHFRGVDISASTAPANGRSSYGAKIVRALCPALRSDSTISP